MGEDLGKSDDAQWAEAAAYIAAHGDRWPDEAFAHLKTLSLDDDPDGFKRWIDLMDMMSEITLAPRQ